MEQQELHHYFFRHRHQIALVFSAFLLGLLLGGSLFWHAKRNLLVKQQEVDRVTAEKNELLGKLAAAEVEARVLRSSQANLKKTLVECEATIAEQDTSLDFYRQLMVVDNKKHGLDLNTYTITVGDEPGIYHFRFAFVQANKLHVILKANVNIRLEGTQKDNAAVYDLHELLVVPDSTFGQLKFKYYQVLEGDLMLPKGFEPRQMIVTAEIKLHKQEWQRKLPWHVEEL